MTEELPEMKELAAITARLDELEPERLALRERAAVLVVAALTKRVPPKKVVDSSPFSAAHVRALAREADVPPAAPGVKPKRSGSK